MPALLKSGQTLIFNNTKVIYARLFFQKETGAHIEIFCLEPLVPADYARNFESNYYCEWSCMVGNLKNGVTVLFSVVLNGGRMRWF